MPRTKSNWEINRRRESLMAESIQLVSFLHIHVMLCVQLINFPFSLQQRHLDFLFQRQRHRHRQRSVRTQTLLQCPARHRHLVKQRKLIFITMQSEIHSETSFQSNFILLRHEHGDIASSAFSIWLHFVSSCAGFQFLIDHNVSTIVWIRQHYVNSRRSIIWFWANSAGGVASTIDVRKHWVRRVWCNSSSCIRPKHWVYW